ncbi:MAG: biopolymer transporter ExbD, partial [Acidobacteria bacterium]|nr:biopolymer transporter ExbD [Acidobacteriota bacterium]
RSEGVVQVGDDRVPVEALAERLRADLADRTEKSVFLRGDGAITYAELVQVVDVIKEGGVQELGLVLAEPTGR